VAGIISKGKNDIPEASEKHVKNERNAAGKMQFEHIP